MKKNLTEEKKQNAVELTDEQTEKVNGGTVRSIPNNTKNNNGTNTEPNAIIFG